MNQDRREEHHCGVQVEHGGHDRYQQQASGEQHYRPSRETLQGSPGLLEQTVTVGYQADQQQPGNEHERRPGYFYSSAQHPAKPARSPTSRSHRIVTRRCRLAHSSPREKPGADQSDARTECGPK